METLFKQQYGPWALVTGAAMGLGAEFALQIAQKGISIIAIDNNHNIKNAIRSMMV